MRTISSSARPLFFLIGSMSNSEVSTTAFLFDRTTDDSMEEKYPLSSFLVRLRFCRWDVDGRDILAEGEEGG